MLALAAVLSGQQAAGRNADVVEADSVGAARRQELVVESDRVEVGDPLVARDGRRLVHTVRERVADGAAEEVGRCRVEDPDDVVRRGRDVGIEVIADVAQIIRAEVVDIEGRAQKAQLLAAKPDEPQLVRCVYVLQHLGDVQDRRGARRVVEHARSVDRVKVRVDDQDMVRVATL